MTENSTNVTPPVFTPPPETGGPTGGAAPAERLERSPAAPGNPVDLSEAYRALQAEVDQLRATLAGGRPPVPPAVPDAAETPAETPDGEQKTSSAKEVLAGSGIDYDALSAEFNTSGELSETTYKALSEAGLHRDIIDSYIAGQQALAEQVRHGVFEIVGGEGNYTAMSAWASTHLPRAEVDAFNTLLETGSLEQVRLAVRGLHDAWRVADGRPPQLLMGAMTGQALEPFQSKAEIIAAMSDPRYAKDSAYRETVHQRLSLARGT